MSLTLKFRQADIETVSGTVTDQGETPLDLTGYEVRVRIYGAPIENDVDIDVDIDDAVQGEYSFLMDVPSMGLQAGVYTLEIHIQNELIPRASTIVYRSLEIQKSGFHND